jgi:hypothetical protein
MANRRAAAVPDMSMTDYLQTHVQHAYGHMFQPNGVRILMVVEALRIGEKTGVMRENAFLRFKGSTYGTQDGQHYVKLASTDIAKAVGGMDVTGKHKSNIAGAIQQLMEQSVEAMDAAFAANAAQALSRESILSSYKNKTNVPALTDSVKDGAYLTFAEFLANKPTVAEFELKNDKRKITIQDKSGNPLNCWGVVKNGEIYKCQNDKLVPLDKYQNGYIISTYVSAAQRRNALMFWGAVTGGLAATMIVNGTTALVAADAWPDLNPRPEGTAIDMETGAFIF